MHTVTVTLEGAGGLQILLLRNGVESISPAQTGEATEEALDEGPSPIAPEPKELLWSLGAFLVFLALMRLYLFPRLKKGMEARYGKIRSDLEEADATRAEAQREVADYQAQLAAVRAEAAQRLDAARERLEAERAERLAAVNATINERRAAAAAEVEAARAAARDTVETAVVDVATRAVELTLNKRPDDAVVRQAVADVMSAGVLS